jgi:hypothetical protein
VKRGAVDGPDVLAAGVFVTPDLGETMLADARLGALKDGVTSEAALREVVRINLDHKVDVIKTRGTERAGLPNTDPRKQTYTGAATGVDRGRSHERRRARHGARAWRRRRLCRGEGRRAIH